MVCLLCLRRQAQRTLTEDAVGRIGPYTDEIFRRLNGGRTESAVMRSAAQRHGVKKGQVGLYVRHLAAASRQTGK